jgi:hypothetical protein
MASWRRRWEEACWGGGVPSSVEVVKVNAEMHSRGLDTRWTKDYGEPIYDINAVTCLILKRKLRCDGCQELSENVVEGEIREGRLKDKSRRNCDRRSE